MGSDMQEITINHLSIAHLSIDRAEVLRYLRLPAHMSEADLSGDITAQIAAAEEAVLAAAEPRFVWREFDITPSPNGILLNGTALELPGLDIAALLAGCRKCLLIAATIGQAAENLIRRAQAQDMAEAIMLDAAAGSAVENLCDNLQAALAAHYAESGLFLTDRYSPGYGDLPLTVQRPFCATLDTARRIGLTVNTGGILLPRKSVTAIIGLADTPRTRQRTCHGCATCNMRETCPYKIKSGVDNNE